MTKFGAAAIVVAGCIAAAGAIAQSPSRDAAPLPIKEFMGHVMLRNAQQLWHWTSFESDEQGERSGKPTSPEQWEDAESDALTLQQLSYALEHTAYRIDEKNWDRHLASFRAAASASADAAEHQDFDRLQKAGDDLNAQCVACHVTFAPEIEAPPPPLPEGF
jgi:hypothetical protein